MNYQEINNKINNLIKSGLYNDSQIDAIKYACFIPNFDENLIIDSSIPENIMLTYIKLAKSNKIDISKYINSKWHLKGFNDEQLYYVIFYDNKGYDISNITSNMSIEEIKNIMNNQINNINLNDSLNNSTMSEYELSKLKEYNLDYKSINFLLRIAKNEDLTIFLNNNLKGFSFEQIKYLYAVYSTGSDIKNILNPNLTVDQMREKILNSNINFINEITEIHNNRKHT